MKHINITNWQGNITDWTKFNYIYGGLDETIADRVNLSIPGTNLRNYFRKSENLISLENETITASGLTFTIKNGKISSSGTPSGAGWIRIKSIDLNVGTYSYTDFTSANSRVYLINTSYVQLTDTFTVTKASTYYIAVLGRTITNNGQLNNSSLMLVSGSTAPTTYEPYGSMVLVENVGKVDLGSLTWSKQTDGAAPYFRASLTDVASSTLNVSCSEFKTVAWSTLYNSTINKCCAIYYSQYILVRDNSYETAEAFKTAMNGVYLTYELATPKVTVFNQVDLGTLDWNYRAQGAPSYYDAYLPGVVNSINVSCPLYKSAWVFSTNTEDKRICTVQNAIRIRDNALQGSVIDLEAKLKGVIFIYEPASSSANTLSMASPMKLDKTNVEEDIEYLEDTKFNEEILSEEE